MDGIEDLTPSGSPESLQDPESDEDDQSPGLNDSVQTDNRRPYIAHKGMHNFNMDDDIDTDGQQDTREIAVPSFEEISDDEDDMADNTAELARESLHTAEIAQSSNTQENESLEGTKNTVIQGTTSTEFEDISDAEPDEDDVEGSFSPEPDEDEENLNEPISPEDEFENQDDDDNVIINNANVNEMDEQKEESEGHNFENETFPKDIEDEDIEAPVPSPFSDIGEMSGPENALISDILKETSGDSIHNEFIEENPHDSVSVEPLSPITEEKSLDAAPQADNEDSNSSLPPISPDELNETSTEAPADDSAAKAAADDSVAANQENQDGEVKEDVGGLINEIFGESDDEEEFEGFGQEELYPEKTKAKARAIISDDDEDEDDDTAPGREEEQPALKVPAPEEESSDDERPRDRPDFSDMHYYTPAACCYATGTDEIRLYRIVSDFDLMMQKKKEMNRNRRRANKDIDIINDNDDIIAAMIKQMRDAAEEDRLLNQAGQAATKKLKLLPSIVTHLRKADLQGTFIDCGILPVIKEWLSPLPDNSLPHVQIRERFLKILEEFPPLDKGALKMSGVGRAVMLLFKHPKESRNNRKIAGRIISTWARPIFGVATKFTDVSREEREERDKSTTNTAKKRRLSSTGSDTGTPGSMQAALSDEKKPRRPGDKGFIGRARVPMPSNKDYVVRPQSSFDMEISKKNTKKVLSRFEKQSRKYKERINRGKIGARAVQISLNGSKLAL